MNKYFIAIFIVTLLIIVYKSITNTYDDYLYGVWIANDDAFCDMSNIESLLIFIGDKDSGWRKTNRNCYIIISPSICNQGFSITYTGPSVSRSFGRYSISADVLFDDEPLWADKVTLDVDMRNGTLCIHDGKTIYAKAYKQHNITELNN